MAIVKRGLAIWGGGEKGRLLNCYKSAIKGEKIRINNSSLPLKKDREEREWERVNEIK